MLSVDYILSLLDGQRPAEEQKQGLKLADRVSNINVFVMPRTKRFHKNIWNNCAKIICAKSDYELEYSKIHTIFEWIKDPMFPGRELIKDKLSKSHVFDRILDDYIKYAGFVKNKFWDNELRQIRAERSKLDRTVNNTDGTITQLLNVKDKIGGLTYINDLLVLLKNESQENARRIAERITDCTLDIDSFIDSYIRCAYTQKDKKSQSVLLKIKNDRALKGTEIRQYKEEESTVDIDFILDLISWRSQESDQARGITAAKEIEQIGAFIMPASFESWHNSAIIVSDRTDEELKLYLPELLTWIEDLQRPGAETIFKRLKKYSRLTSEPVFNSVLQFTEETDDIQWHTILHELL